MDQYSLPRYLLPPCPIVICVVILEIQILEQCARPSYPRLPVYHYNLCINFKIIDKRKICRNVSVAPYPQHYITCNNFKKTKIKHVEQCDLKTQKNIYALLDYKISVLLTHCKPHILRLDFK